VDRHSGFETVIRAISPVDMRSVRGPRSSAIEGSGTRSSTGRSKATLANSDGMFTGTGCGAASGALATPGSMAAHEVREGKASGATGATFLNQQTNTASASLQIDRAGGLHAAYVSDPQEQAYYSTCAPPADCADRASWTETHFGSHVREVQLELTPQGQPRMLLLINDPDDGDPDINDSWWYAACQSSCASSASWSMIFIGGHADIDVESFYTSNHYFALDPQGLTKSGLVSWLSPAKRRIGSGYERFPLRCTVRVRPFGSLHVAVTVTPPLVSTSTLETYVPLASVSEVSTGLSQASSSAGFLARP